MVIFTFIVQCRRYMEGPVHYVRYLVWLRGTPWWHHQMEIFSALLTLGTHRSPVNSTHRGQRRGALMFSLICAWTNGWVNTRDTSDWRRHRAPRRRCSTYGRDGVSCCYLRFCNLCRPPWLASSDVVLNVCSGAYLVLSVHFKGRCFCFRSYTINSYILSKNWEP